VEQRVTNVILKDMPPITAITQRTQAMTQVVKTVALEMNGRTLVLFSALSRLAAVAKQLQNELKGTAIKLLVQSWDGPSAKLVEQMRQDEHTVLLACQSFWQGTNIIGPALSCVIIERIPFDPPKRPIVAARLKHFQNEEGNGFRHYLLPTALIKLRQGAGRLIRSETDRGVIILCHEDMMRKAYRDQVQQALPGKTLQWISRHELRPLISLLAKELKPNAP
jgi:ATP-dependent DNA helicase DinG